MTWNYRVMRHTDSPDGEPHYEIHEVFYSEDRSKPGWTRDAVKPFGCDLVELRQSLEWMTLALDKLVLDYDTGEEIATALAEQPGPSGRP